MTEELTKDELTEEFGDAVREAIEESDLPSTDEVRQMVDRRVSKADLPEDTDEDEEAPTDDEERRYTREELREELPDDIADTVLDHLAETAVSKALGVRQTDPFLARQQEDISSVHDEVVGAAEKAQEARAEAVAEGDAEVPLLHSTGIYDEEDG